MRCLRGLAQRVVIGVVVGMSSIGGVWALEHGGIDSGGGFLVNVDIPADSLLLKSTVDDLPNAILAVYNSINLHYAFSAEAQYEFQREHIRRIQEVLSPEEVEQIRVHYRNMEAVVEKVFTNEDFPETIKKASIIIEEGPCFARDGSERDASIVHPTHDICISESRILSKVTRSTIFLKVLPLLFKEYGRLAGLNDDQALALQTVIGGFDVNASVYRSFTSMHESNYFEFQQRWKQLQHEVKVTEGDSVACYVVGGISSRLANYFFRLSNHLSLLSTKDYIKLMQTEVKIGLLGRFCSKRDYPNRVMSLREYFELQGRDPREEDFPEATWFERALFSDEVTVLPIPFKDKQALVLAIAEIDADLEKLDSIIKPKN